MAKLKKKEYCKENLIKPPGWLQLASPIVVLRKPDKDIRILEEYKVNHQICLDSFPLPNIETTSHKLAKMKYFAKIDFNSAYKQIEIDRKFKEITTKDIPIGLLR